MDHGPYGGGNTLSVYGKVFSLLGDSNTKAGLETIISLTMTLWQ